MNILEAVAELRKSYSGLISRSVMFTEQGKRAGIGIVIVEDYLVTEGAGRYTPFAFSIRDFCAEWHVLDLDEFRQKFGA